MSVVRKCVKTTFSHLIRRESSKVKLPASKPSIWLLPPLRMMFWWVSIGHCPYGDVLDIWSTLGPPYCSCTITTMHFKISKTWFSINIHFIPLFVWVENYWVRWRICSSFRESKKQNTANLQLTHHGAEGSSLAFWIKLKALSKLFGQQMVQEDRKSWNLEGRRGTWMVFRP